MINDKVVKYNSGDIKYIIKDDDKIVPIDITNTLKVGGRQWSRMFMYADRDLVIKDKDNNNNSDLYDAETGNKVAEYDRSLNKKQFKAT